MSQIKKLAKETAIYGMSHILPRLLNFGVMTIYLTHKFNEDTIDYGIYSELYAYATIILAFMVFRMDTAYFRFGTKTQEKDLVLSTAYVPVLIITILLTSTFIIFDNQIASWLDYENQPYYVRWFAWILGLDALTTLIYGKFRLESRPLRFMFYRVLNVLLTVGFVFVFLEILPRLSPNTKDGIYNILGMQRDLDFVFLSNLIASAVVAIAMIPELKGFRWKIDYDLLKQILRYSWPLVVVALGGNIIQVAAPILQKYWLPNSLDANLAQAGIYSAGAKLAIFLNLFTTAFNYAAEPFFFNNANKKGVEKDAVYGDVALAYTLFASMVVIGTYLFVDLVLFLIGSNYHSSVIVVPYLLFSYLILGLYYMVSIWYKLSDNTLSGAAITLIGVLVTIVVNAICLPIYGIVASAWASVFCQVVMLLICIWWGRRVYHIVYPWAKIASILVVVFLTLAIGMWLRDLYAEDKVMLLLVNFIVFVTAVIALYAKEKTFLDRSFGKGEG